MFSKSTSFGLLFSSLALLCACGHKDDSHNESPKAPYEPKVRSMEGFKLKSAESLAIEDVCQSLSDFFRDYQKNYISGAEFKALTSKEKKQCSSGLDFGDGEIIYRFTFSLSQNGEAITITAPITLIFDETAGLFNVGTNGLEKVDGLSNSSLEAVLTSGDDWTENFGDGLKDLDKTFHAWLDVEKKDLLIFGHPYSEFLTALETSFSSNQNTSSAITPTLKFKLEPSSKVKGEVKFIDVDPDYFKKEQGSDNAMFLGCEHLACLNSSGITYNISLNTITFRSAPTVGNEAGISTSTTKEFSIVVQGFPKN